MVMDTNYVALMMVLILLYLMAMDKLEVDYETNTIGIRHPNGYYPLFNTKARSRGLPTPPQLEILHTDYTAKALQHGWNPESWSLLIQ